MLIGTAWMARVSVDTPYLTGIAIPMIIFGIGQGLGLSTLTNAGMAGVAPRTPAPPPVWSTSPTTSAALRSLEAAQRKADISERQRTGQGPHGPYRSPLGSHQRRSRPQTTRPLEPPVNSTSTGTTTTSTGNDNTSTTPDTDTKSSFHWAHATPSIRTRCLLDADNPANSRGSCFRP
jgi:hypothetical protein